MSRGPEGLSHRPIELYLTEDQAVEAMRSQEVLCKALREGEFPSIEDVPTLMVETVEIHLATCPEEHTQLWESDFE